MPPKLSAKDVQRACETIRGALPQTSLTYAPIVSEHTHRQVWFKWENKLRTGSFKERGALNLIASLTPEEKKHGVCAASAGNHALALSYHAARHNVPCIIVMPENAPIVKYESTKNHGAEVILHGQDFNQALQRARALAKQRGAAFISAYDHPLVIAGQGTIATELLEQHHDFDSIIVPVGGGGLIAGIALAIKAVRPEVHILGVQSEWAAYWQMPPELRKHATGPANTIADGIALKTLGKLTKPIIEQHVDSLVTVSETDLAHAIIQFLEWERTVVEGAGAAPLAALLYEHLPAEFKKTILIVSGSNIDINILSRLIDRSMAERHRLIRLRVSVPDRFGALHRVTGIIAQQGANILNVFHDRSFSQTPGNVDISFLLEVRDRAHGQTILTALKNANIQPLQH